MSLFDLLFILIFLSTILTVVAIAILLICRRRVVARRILIAQAATVGLYLSVLIVVSLLSQRRVLKIGENQCFDDWCASVIDVHKQRSADRTSYRVTFRLSSRAKGRPQRALDAHVYLIDDSDRRYDPLPAGSAIPFDVLLKPQESVETTRVFEIPSSAANPAIVVSHGEGFPGWFIIGGSNSLFHQPTVTRIE